MLLTKSIVNRRAIDELPALSRPRAFGGLDQADLTIFLDFLSDTVARVAKCVRPMVLPEMFRYFEAVCDLHH